MARINYKEIFEDIDDTIYDEIYGKEDVSILNERGKEIHERAKQHNIFLGEDASKKYYAHYRDGNYAVSERAQRDMRGLYHVPGNFEYRNPSLDLALSFARKNSDKKLIKALEKIDKYSKAAYEEHYKAYSLALDFYEKGKRTEAIIEKKQDMLDFMKKHEKYTKLELLNLRRKKKEMISSASGELRNTLEIEIKLLDELINMTERKRKKVIITKGKEIEEIKSSAKKNQSYKNRYIRYLRKAYKRQKFYGDEFRIAWEIIKKMREAITPVFYVQLENGDKKKLNIPSFEVDQIILARIEDELVSTYYPNSNTKAK